MKAILASTAKSQDLLNLAETVKGWTPLFIACVNGRLPIVKLLLEAGAKQRLCDLTGWTEKEYAVFRGHTEVAELLAAHGAGSHGAPTSSGILRTGMIRPGEPLICALQSQTRISSRLEPSELTPNCYRIQRHSSQIFVTLGPSNTRSNLKPVEMTSQSFDHDINDANQKTRFGVMIKAGGTKSTSAHCIELPMVENMINKPLQFATEDPDDVNVVFELFRNSSASDKGIQIIGTGIALLKSLRQGLALKRESLIRDYTVPILENGPMTYIGSVIFSALIVTPFQPLNPPPRVSPRFWNRDGSTQIIGHRGSGVNSTARTNL